MDAPLLVAWLGLAGDHGLVSGACQERVSGVQVQGERWWMVYLGLGAALRCWARLDAYRREGRRQLLVEDIELNGGLEALPGSPPALDRVPGKVSVVAPDDPAPRGSFIRAEAL